LRLAAACLAVALFGVAAQAGAAPPPAAREKELRELRGRIEALQKRLTDAEGLKNEAVDALRESERAISEANRELRGLAQQARAADARLAELNAESARAQQALKEQQALLARLLYHHYINGQPGPLRLLLNREDPSRIVRQLHYFEHISRARSEAIAGLRASLRGLRELALEAESSARELAAIAAEQQVQRHRLERERTARGATLSKLAREIRQRRREIGTLRRDEDRLARLVQSLARLMAREKRPAPRLRNERTPQRGAGDAPFAALRGRLALPVRGELASRFGAPRADGGTVWKGLFIAARPGQEVRAIAAGRVVFADWLRGFGNLLIIDHGGAYMSLYGNNESLYKRVGDIIHGGDAIAAVGNSGGNPDSGLYFELRYEGKPLDPLGWVEIR
jgi:septal ring factor EnvC (AmiA/AmiB activator)